MSDRDPIETHAADSRLGVNDGRATGETPRYSIKPGGWGRAFNWLALSIVLSWLSSSRDRSARVARATTEP